MTLFLANQIVCIFHTNHKGNKYTMYIRLSRKDVFNLNREKSSTILEISLLLVK